MTVFDKLPPKVAGRVAMMSGAIAAALGLAERDQVMTLHLAADWLAPILWEPDEPGCVSVRLTVRDAQSLMAKLHSEIGAHRDIYALAPGWKDSVIGSLNAALAGVPGGVNRPGRRFWVCDCDSVNPMSHTHCWECDTRAPHSVPPAIPSLEVRRLREA